MDNPLNKKVIELYLETAKELFEEIKIDDHESFKKNFDWLFMLVCCFNF